MRTGGRAAAVLGVAALAWLAVAHTAFPPARDASATMSAREVVAPARTPASRPAPPTTVAVAVPSTSPVPPTTPATTAPPAVPAVQAPPTVVATVPARAASAAVDFSGPLDGLDPLPAGWSASVHTVAVAGLRRTYLTLAPRTLTGRVPVLVLLHGVAMDATGIVNLTGLAARTGPAVIVAPEGWHRSWNAGGCCGAAFRAGIDDVAFIRAALAEVLAANPAADPSRVYAVGFSNGGRMAYRLACDLPGTFAGFVAAEAVPVRGCSALQPLDITIVAQQDDPLLSVDAGQSPKWVDGSPEPTVAATVERERALDGCAGPPAVTYAGVAEIRRWTCAAGHELTYAWYPGGSHSWRAPAGPTPGTTDLVLDMIDGARPAEPAGAVS